MSHSKAKFGTVKMPKITLPLSDTEVKNAKPRSKEYSLMDGRGLKLRVSTTGVKTWLFNYSRPSLKSRTNIGLGRYPDVSLSNARRKAEEFRRQLANGIDPQEPIKTEVETFQSVAERWFKVKIADTTKAHGEDIWRSFERYVFPKLAHVPIQTLLAPTVIAILQPIAAKGTLETVKRLCQRINEVMVFAANTGVIEQNPLAGIRRAFATPVKQNFPALRPDELPELMSALSFASIKRTTRILIEFQLHTLTRPSEAAGGRWEEIDLAQAIWTIPATRMKRDKEHKIPLTQQAIALLEKMQPISGHLEHVFPADRNPKTHTNEQTANMALKRMGFEGRLVSHGLRSIGSTALNEQGFEPDLIEVALAHIGKDKVRNAYNRADYMPRRRVMMEFWSEYIQTAAAAGAMSSTRGLRAGG